MEAHFMLKAMGYKTSGTTKRLETNIGTKSSINSHCKNEQYSGLSSDETKEHDGRTQKFQAHSRSITNDNTWDIDYAQKQQGEEENDSGERSKT